MKKRILIFLLAANCVTAAFAAFVTGGGVDVAVTHTPQLIQFGGSAGTLYVYNHGTGTVYCAFGARFYQGEEDGYAPIKPGASITLQNTDVSLMTVATATNTSTAIDYGFAGD